MSSAPSTNHFRPQATLEIMSDDTIAALSEKARETLSKYLEAFLAPVKDDRCIRCPACHSHVYSGDLSDALFGTFQWGIAHGDGFCSKCGWNIRMYHFVDLGEGEQRFVYPLAYRCFNDDDIEINPVEWYEKKQEDVA